MKNILFFFSLIMTSTLIHAQEVMIPDSIFKNMLLNCNTCATFLDGSKGVVDKNKNGKIEVSEVESVISLNLKPKIHIPGGFGYSDIIGNLQGIKAFKNIKDLDCSNNQLTTLDLTGLDSLKDLDCSNNQLTTLDLTGLDSLKSLGCGYNMITNIEMNEKNKFTEFWCGGNKLKFIEWEKLGKDIKSLNVSYNPLQNSDNIKFNIYPKLNHLRCAGLKLTKLDLTGLDSLEYLDCSRNDIPKLSLENNSKLNYLYFSENKLTSIQPINLQYLKQIDCSNNQLTELILNKWPNLEYIWCDHNQLKSLDLTTLKHLQGIYCSYNQLNKLDNLYFKGGYGGFLECNNNKITDLKIKGRLQGFDCSNNLLETLDFSECEINLLIPFGTGVSELNIGNNPLKYINFKNAFEDDFLIDNINIPQSLKYICCDENEIEYVKNIFQKASSGNIEFNSYCSFTPGGKFYVIKGQAKYGIENSNCQGADASAFPNLKFNITGNINSGTLITNNQGTFEIPVNQGSHTFTPILEFPDLFNITPISFKATFPNTSDTIIQNFCITPKVSISNVIIEIVPVTVARPGFEASYKIIITNKGTKTENGSVNFNFDNSIMKLISSSLTPESVNGGIINWKFENLKPFGSIEIIVVLKVNSPMDIPAINAGDIFNLTASILNNKKTINITVVGSYDPNDKTCLQGNQLRTDLIGKYVDYLIRFENTGNYFAENVVIKDIIDTSRFQVNSLEVVNSSHKMVTRINKNVVEFIFENIKLPFPPDDKRHGYVLFKIKTKDNLKLGDSLKNEASIYFDYNFPIKTNRFESVVRNPSSTNYESIIEASIYPNPVKDILTIKSDNIIKTAEIYNVQGQLMEAIINPSQNIRLSHLINGTYVIKLHSKDGVYTSRFIKM
jgi:uncharacterized repeat protein (TIGR01451 family)